MQHLPQAWLTLCWRGIESWAGTTFSITRKKAFQSCTGMCKLHV